MADAIDQELADLQVAEWIAEYLFTNGQGEKAERLVLTSSDGRDLGGFAKKPVIDAITRNLKELRDVVRLGRNGGAR